MQQFETLIRKKDGQPLRYLVVDDSVFARKNLQRILAMFGGTVAGEAENGLAAVEAYDRLQPDLVLMDVTMPELEGSPLQHLCQRSGARFCGNRYGPRGVRQSRR